MLVLIVILVFLQDWRAVLIPATTVPVTIIGAFAAMGALGFSVNMLTLFGLVLAIGIVVDDAIVIVENAAHHIDHDQAARPSEATIKAMGEVIGPVIGITLVLMAVFLPTAFLGGITGQLYRQFALTIAATAVISADQRRDPEAGPVRHVPEADPDPEELLLSRASTTVYDRVRGGLHGDRPAAGPPRPAGDGRVRRPGGLDGLVVLPAPHRLPAGRRPGVRHRRTPAPRRLVAGEDPWRWSTR